MFWSRGSSNITFISLLLSFTLMERKALSQRDCLNYTPNGYDPTIAPEISTEVQVQESIRSITKLDEVQGLMELQLYLYNRWRDERLFSDGFSQRFKVSETGPASEMIELPRHSRSCIWTGMVYFDELLGGEMFDDDMNHPYVELIPAEKRVQVIARYRVQILCTFSFYNYPMDSQDCTITFKPRMRANYFLAWSKKNATLDPKKFKVSTFTLVDLIKWKKMDSYGRMTLKLTFKFQRKIATALIAVYFPSTLIVLISFVSFWVDSLAVPGRITLVITSLLALMTQLVAVRDKATPVSYVTAMDIWFFACLAFVSGALFEFALSYNFAVQRDTISLISSPNLEEGKNSRKWTFSGKICRFKRKVNLYLIPAPGLDGISRFLFPILFFLFTIGYWIYYGLFEEERIQLNDDY